MTFEEFQETKFESRDLGAAIPMDTGSPEAVPGNVYCGYLHIEQVLQRTADGHPNVLWDEGKWHLTIETHSVISNDLDALERQLFDWAMRTGFNFRSVEDSYDREINMLVREYAAFNERNNLKLGSADDHLCDETLTPEQQEWVREFSDRWDASVTRSSAKRASKPF